jgi:hypothetical protein
MTVSGLSHCEPRLSRTYNINFCFVSSNGVSDSYLFNIFYTVINLLPIIFNNSISHYLATE